jgi:hypothetical protein
MNKLSKEEQRDIEMLKRELERLREESERKRRMEREYNQQYERQWVKKWKEIYDSMGDFETNPTENWELEAENDEFFGESDETDSKD